MPMTMMLPPFPRQARSLYYLAQLVRRQGTNNARCEALMKRAIDADPQNVNVIKDYGRAHSCSQAPARRCAHTASCVYV